MVGYNRNMPRLLAMALWMYLFALLMCGLLVVTQEHPPLYCIVFGVLILIPAINYCCGH